MNQIKGRHPTWIGLSLGFFENFLCHCIKYDAWSFKCIGLFHFDLLGRDRFASSGRGISSAGSRIVAHETIDQTETGRRWLTMFAFLRLQLKYKNG